MRKVIPSVSVSGAPTIEFRFDGDTCTASLAGANLYAEVRNDGRCDLRVTDSTRFVLADIVLNERPGRTLTENLIDVGSALLWSHWRFTDSSPHMSADPEKHTANG